MRKGCGKAAGERTHHENGPSENRVFKTLSSGRLRLRLPRLRLRLRLRLLVD